MNRHYLNAGGVSIGVLVSSGALPALGAGVATPPTLASITLVKVEYWHKDHLGSIVATTDHTGAVTARYAFDAFGKRRYASGVYDQAGTLIIDYTTNTNNGTDRGYTGHEQLDDIGLTHMNGRLFDPLTGRFLQTDPFVQDPSSLQNFNRYGYCFNNPLNCSDATGQFFGIDDLIAGIWTLVGIWTAEKLHIIDAREARMFTGLLVGAELAPCATCPEFAGGGMTQAAVAGFASGAISSGSFQGGVQGAFSAGMFYGAGNVIDGGNFFTGGKGAAWGYWEGVALHGVVGCVTSVAGGAKCGLGALSAAFSNAAAPVTMSITHGDVVGGMAVSAVIGGTASELGGGKFSNGATTGAFSYLFNHCAHVEGGCWKALKDAAKMTMDWATGRGAQYRVFGPGSIQVIDMMDAPGVNGAREFFYQKNPAALSNEDYGSLQPVTNWGASFGLKDLLTNSSPTQQFVGSYRVDIFPVNDGSELMFVLTNNSSFKSFGYGVTPDWERSSFGPAGNMRQIYWWTEPRRQ